MIETVHHKTIRYILYRRLIANLRRAYRQQTEITPKELTPYQQARLTGDREIYYQLQQIEKIPDVILNPEPMPVEVAPIQELFLRHCQAYHIIQTHSV